ncbi:unnamed protein product, partial [Amoebophrya sp. A25]
DLKLVRDALVEADVAMKELAHGGCVMEDASMELMKAQAMMLCGDEGSSLECFDLPDDFDSGTAGTFSMSSSISFNALTGTGSETSSS